MAICSDCESAVPLGQIAFATLGAACKAVTRASAAVPATPAISGPARKERPAVRAERRSERTRLVCWMGSISRMRGWLRRRPERVA